MSESVLPNDEFSYLHGDRNFRRWLFCRAAWRGHIVLGDDGSPTIIPLSEGEKSEDPRVAYIRGGFASQLAPDPPPRTRFEASLVLMCITVASLLRLSNRNTLGVPLRVRWPRCPRSQMVKCGRSWSRS